MARRRIAVVGLGMAVAPHAESAIALADRVELAWVCSPSPARRQAFAARWPALAGVPQTGSLDEVLADRSVEAVVLLTPPATHLPLVERCAAAGRHVLLEKPLEVSTARAERLVAACRDAGVTLGVVLQHRFRPAALELAARLRAGALGRIVSASAGIRLWRPQSYYDQPGRGTIERDGGGVLLTQGIHTLDLLLHLAGPIAEVAAFATTTPVHRMETEDLVCAAVRYRSGAHGTIEASTAAFPGYPERIELTGEAGTATLSGSALRLRLHDGTAVDLEPAAGPGGTGADPMAFPSDWHRALWSDFLDALDTGRPAAIDGGQALDVHRLIDALLASGAAGGQPRPVAP
ncbi:MAG: gfo/Idh/MocA family oxidoreductase [Burkholderiales bacterium]|nr:MAG: gfo/Idh/MocA family oxidoreductase [Burkholderiales bacterium]